MFLLLFCFKMYVSTDWDRVKMLEEKVDTCNDNILKTLVIFGAQNIERRVRSQLGKSQRERKIQE